MKGTEKQIAWAEDIQKTVIEIIEKMQAMVANDPRMNDPHANTEAAKAARVKVARALEAVKACDNAHDLIEVYRGVSSRNTERQNVGMVGAAIMNKTHVQYDTPAQMALIGE